MKLALITVCDGVWSKNPEQSDTRYSTVRVAIDDGTVIDIDAEAYRKHGPDFIRSEVEKTLEINKRGPALG